MALLLLIIVFVIVILIQNLLILLHLMDLKYIIFQNIIVLFLLFFIKIGGFMKSYIIGTLRNMDSMIEDIFSLLDRKDLDHFRYVNRIVCNQFAWVAVLAGYDSPIFQYVEKKLNYYYRYVIFVKNSHKHAPNIL